LSYLDNINNLKGKSIYIPQFPKGQNISYSKGYINEIDNYELIHNGTTKSDSSGSPIFLENSTQVIGIHKLGNINKTENYGNFIYQIIQLLRIKGENEYNMNINEKRKIWKILLF
jgi:V8-like Glu-specific endopeptidase